MSTWKPTEGLTKAEMLVQILEVEARAAGSNITPVFRHRMVEMIAKTLDGGVVGVLTIPDGTVFQNGAMLRNGKLEPHDDDTDDEAVRFAEQFEGMDGVTVAYTDTGRVVKPAKAAKGGKPKGKRGRPSKAEIAARKAAQA